MKTETTLGMCSLLAAVAGGIAAVPALADDGCSIYRINVPDLDQKRTSFNDIMGLPNGGNMFCVPTSTSNWLGYMATLDFPQVFHGEPEWFSVNGYNSATSDINFLGLMMDTSPTGGTGNQGWYDGVSGWFNPNSYPDIIHASYDLPASGITPYTMYTNMKAGYLVLICYGRYTIAPPSGNLPQRFVRGSGHCVTLTTVTNACSQISNIGYRDPASGGDSTTTQSGFATRYINVTPRQDYFAGNSTDTPNLRTYTQMAGTVGDPVYRFIDKLRIIYPVEGLSADPIDGVLSAKKFYDFNMGLTSPPRHTHALPTVPNRVVRGVKHHPFLPAAAVIVDGNTGGGNLPGVYNVSLIGEEPVRVGPVPTGSVTFAVDGNLYVGLAGQIQGLNFMNPASPPVVCGLGGQTLLALDSGEPGLGGDNQAFNIYAITRNSAGQSFIAAIPTHPGGCGPFNPQPLPRDVQIPGGCEMAQTREHILLARQGFSNILRLGIVTGGGWVVEETIGLPESGEPKNLQVDERGNIYYTVDGSVRVLRQPVGGGGWVPATDSMWFGYGAGEFFSLTRSRQSTSFWADGPGDVNVDPEVEEREIGGTVVIDCPADFNNDGFVDFFDYDAFVACFEGGECPPDNPARLSRDFNHDGFVDFFDIDAFVEAFERGC